MQGSRIAFCKSPMWPLAGVGRQAAWERAFSLLRKRGSIVEEIDLPEDFAEIKEWHAKVLVGEERTSFLGSKCHSSNPCYQVPNEIVSSLYDRTTA